MKKATAWRRILRRHLFSILALAALLFLYAFSRGGGTTLVRIEVQNDVYSLYLDGRQIMRESLPSWSSGGIGYRQYRGTVPIIPHPQGITDIEVVDLDTGDLVFEEDFDDGQLDSEVWTFSRGPWRIEDGFLTAGTDEALIMTSHREWRNYAMQARVSNLFGAQFFFRVQDDRNYAGCFMRPFRDFDSNFFVIENGQRTRQSRVKMPLLSPWETSKKSLDLLTHHIPSFLAALVGLILGGAVAVGFLTWFWPHLAKFSSTLLAGKDRASPPLATIAAVLLAVGAFGWLLHVTVDYLESIPHVQDSAIMVFQAKMLAGGRLSAKQPSNPESFTLSGPFVHFRNQRMFGQYPFGHPLFLAAGMLVNRLSWMPAMAGALLLLIVFLIGRHLLSAGWGLLASFLLFCSPFLQMSAPNFMSHTTGALYFAVSFYALIRIDERLDRLLWPALGGAFLGLLFNTRPMTAVAAAAAYGLFMLGSTALSSHKKRLALQYGVFVLAGSLLFGLWALSNYVLMGDPFASTYASTADRVLVGSWDWNRLAKGLLDNFTLAGLFVMVIFGWSGFLTTAPFLGAFLPSSRSSRPLMLMLACIVFVFAGYMLFSLSSVTVMYGPRYVFEIAFLYVLVCVAGIERIVEMVYLLGSRLAGMFPEWLRFGIGADRESFASLTRSVIVTPLLLVPVVLAGWGFLSWISPGARPWPGNAFIPQNLADLKGFNYTSPTAQQLVADNRLSMALVFVEGPRDQWWHYGSAFAENSPDFNGDIVYAKARGKDENAAVIRDYPDRKVYQINYTQKRIWELDRDGEVIHELEAVP